MKNNSLDEVVSFLGAYKRYYLIGHMEPDGDCIASQLALSSWLERRGKKAIPVSAGPFTRTEIASYEPFFSDLEADHPVDDSAYIILDCSNLERTGSIAEKLKTDLPLAFIDHHFSASAEADISYIDASAPAVTWLVQNIMEHAGMPPDKKEAELLLFGLCTDTGFFRHLEDNSSRIFMAASRLVAAGASPKKTFNMMHGGKSIESRKMLGILLDRVELHYGGQLLVSWLDAQDMVRFEGHSRDSDMLYQLLLGIKGVEVVVVIRQESHEACSIGFRSLSFVDVSAIAQKFGGGGHRRAAGLYMEGQAESIKVTIVEAFSRIFDLDKKSATVNCNRL